MKIVIEVTSFEELHALAKSVTGMQAEQVAVQAEQAADPAPDHSTQAEQTLSPAVQETPAVTPAGTAAPTMPEPVQTTAPVYSLDDLARAAIPLMDAGKQAELVALLGRFGVTTMPELKPEQFGPFATALRGLGAAI